MMFSVEGYEKFPGLIEKFSRGKFEVKHESLFEIQIFVYERIHCEIESSWLFGNMNKIKNRDRS